MKQLNAKKIKRHMLKTYEFWQIDEKFLIIPGGQKFEAVAGVEQLPPSDIGYIAYAFLDEYMRVVFLGEADEDKNTYRYFDGDELLVVPAQSIENILVRVVNPTADLIEHPFVEGVLAFHESNALVRSTLSLRSLDLYRDPLFPAILTACFIRDEVRKEKAYDAELAAFVERVKPLLEMENEEPPVLPDAPAVPDEDINFIKIKDLSPANNGSWRAVLLESLPGTRVKRKGDDVSISLETVTLDEVEYVVPFINHLLPVEGTDITVEASKPFRLPWRLAYEMDCPDCDFKETFYLGRHGEDSYMFKEILGEIRQGKVDPAILIDLVQRDDTELDFSRELYRCRNCSTLAVMKRLRLVTPDKTFSAAYNCPVCGERMSQVKRGHIASLDCPDCRKPLNLVSEKQWSGVPETEIIE